MASPEVARTAPPDLIASVPTEKFLDFMGVGLNPEGADDEDVKINLEFTDTDEQFVLHLKNSVLNNMANRQDPDAAVSLSMTRKLFDLVALEETSIPVEIVKGNVKLSGNPLALLKVFGRLEDFNPNFAIVTP